jgi:CRP/FNR family transcriptional regulator
MAQDDMWLDRFAGLARLEPAIKAQLLARSAVVTAPAGTVIFGPGKSPENMLFLLVGTVRVQQVSDTGHEIVLYRIEAGESCVLTTACLLAYDDYAATGIAETDVRAAAVPRDVFDDLVAQSKSFRNFVFAAFSKRITDLFLMIDEVAFQRIDVRLADKLLKLSMTGSPPRIRNWLSSWAPRAKSCRASCRNSSAAAGSRGRAGPS